MTGDHPGQAVENSGPGIGLDQQTVILLIHTGAIISM
jgi:hypothetical protein